MSTSPFTTIRQPVRPASGYQRAMIIIVALLGLVLLGAMWLLDLTFTAYPVGWLVSRIVGYFAPSLMTPAVLWGSGIVIHCFISFGQYHLWRVRHGLIAAIGAACAFLNIGTSTVGIVQIMVYYSLNWPLGWQWVTALGAGAILALVPEPAITALIRALGGLRRP